MYGYMKHTQRSGKFLMKILHAGGVITHQARNSLDDSNNSWVLEEEYIPAAHTRRLVAAHMCIKVLLANQCWLQKDCPR